MYADLNSTIDKKFKNILSQNKFKIRENGWIISFISNGKF